MDRPIIFSAPMVKAILDGRKSMTRRLAWRDCPKCPGIPSCKRCHGSGIVSTVWQKVQPGDLLWCREAFYQTDKLSRIGWPDGKPTPAVYKADIPQAEWRCAVWTPSIHLPRRLSRLTLEVTATRIERLQEISADDCIAEGIKEQWTCLNPETGSYALENDVRDDFRTLWTKLHGPGSWEANPEVVVISWSEAHQQNIDEFKARRAAKGGS